MTARYLFGTGNCKRGLSRRALPPGRCSARSIDTGGFRLAGIDVAQVVKKPALRAGFDLANYAGHSLRAGHATSAAIAGASERSIMKQTGHRSVQMVRRYIWEGGSWACSACRPRTFLIRYV